MIRTLFVTKVRISMKQTIRRLAPIVVGGGMLFLSMPSLADGPFQFFTLTPCRLADTRNATGPSGGPILSDQAARQFPVQGLCGVPATPVVSSLNFAAGELALGNGAIVPLADQSLESLDLSVYARVLGPGTVHMVLDVTGYFQ
jgi:hypothetical protein